MVAGKSEKVTVSLHELLPGMTAVVVELTSRNSVRLTKLSALGIVPGSVIRLEQRSPAFVIRVGETQLSFDDEVAREILLRPPADSFIVGGGSNEDRN